MQAQLLARLHEEIGPQGGNGFADAARQLAGDFGAVTATAVEAAIGAAPAGDGIEPERPAAAEDALEAERAAETTGPENELASLYQPGHMRRRLEQLIETNRRYGHPFGIAVFDAHGPDTRDKAESQETALALVGAALRESIRIVDEAFRLEEDAICVLAPNIGTVEGVQMAERLLALLDELEQAGGLRIDVAAGVVACPEHGDDADALLHKADGALWRARAVGQPIGVGALQDR
jgi:diguanylate cyclase (GGDEF)-like protein